MKFISWEEAVQKCLDSPELHNLAHDAYFGDSFEACKRYHASSEYKEIKQLIPRQAGKALDLGAGNGILSGALAMDGWDVTAVEPDSSNLVGAGAIRNLAKRANININVLEAMGEEIPIKGSKFDLIVARQVLHHADDLQNFCSEMARLSNQNTLILTLRDHVINNKKQLLKFFDKHPLHHLYGGENAYTIAEYRAAFISAGIKIKKEIKSFDSVINYDPMTKDEIYQNILNISGPLKFIVKILLQVLSFKFICSFLAFIDNRPGRLISFIAQKKVS